MVMRCLRGDMIAAPDEDSVQMRFVLVKGLRYLGVKLHKVEHTWDW